jgi:hypothetical protein
MESVKSQSVEISPPSQDRAMIVIIAVCMAVVLATARSIRRLVRHRLAVWAYLLHSMTASRGLCFAWGITRDKIIVDRPNPRCRKKCETSGLQLCSHGRSSLPLRLSVSMRACLRARRRSANSCGEGLSRLPPTRRPRLTAGRVVHDRSNLLGQPDQRGGLGSVGSRDVIEIGRHLTEAKARAGHHPHMTNRSRNEPLQIMLSSAELTALDNFRFKARMPSRAAAVRELLKRGLAGEGLDLAGSAGVVGKRLASKPTK